MNTPICDFVRDYAEKKPLRFHMPGHKGIGSADMEELDITEVPGADVLYSARGIIAESEANASAIFGSARTLYSVEGSSLCIRTMLYLARLWAEENGRAPLVLAGRNAHKTFLSAVALLDMDVEWLFSESEGQGIVSCLVTAEGLERRLAELSQKPAAVYITSPDYLGCRADIASLAEVCRRHGILLLVDNAHGAYLKFMSTSEHPLDLGADLCCDSAHKTLPVLTGGAYLHLSKSAPNLLCEAAERALALFASTSPSYLTLQSIDAANAVLSDNYVNNVMSTYRQASSLFDSLRDAGWELVGNEPFKLTLRTKPRGYTGVEVAELLGGENIVCEFADDDHIVFMFTASTPAQDFELLSDALLKLAPRRPLTSEPPILCKLIRRLSPREAMLAPSETLPIDEAQGRILASPCVSCPPAVPILVCGEQIDADAVRAFCYYGVERVEVVRERIVAVDETNVSAAGAVHAAAWRASHASFCAPDFVAAHTAERQSGYLRDKLAKGAKLYMLLSDKPIGVVSVTGGLIEDLYILPERQNAGFGTKLLRHAVGRCDGTPTLWILENNTGAARLYAREGFVPTGNRKDGGKLAELEYKLT
ncbi:MAG: GNAT family N-acetyltransferase [Oscillospiraceae bacterium]|nr:GNAT family N-acetyltransferase [Oscillospiraceae bacterium]